ncbi:MAG: sugar transferase [Clostridia bacterium]|nr:sugar transferase [Clostridia bacterium]
MYKYIKRAIDVVCSFFALVVLSPLLLITAIAIKLDSKGPVLFNQLRTGKGGKPFLVHKFRSMTVDEKNQEITKVGKVIRKLSIDELPQLINILKGEMSIIGPRPWVAIYYDLFTDEQKRRNSIAPGLSGWAQVNGRADLNILDRIELDLWYIDHMCFWLDLKILFKTIYSVIFRKGINITTTIVDVELEVLQNMNRLNNKNN